MTETKTIQFWIPCDPPKTTYQSGSTIFRRRDGTPMIGKNRRGEHLKYTLITFLEPYQPAEPLTGPVQLRIKYVFPWRKSEPKRNRERGWMWCDKRPDADNIAKQLCDVLTLLRFFEDDGQVALLQVEKQWGDDPGIGVCLETLNAAIFLEDL